MADSKITALTAISTVDPTADPLVIVDVSDTSMAASGTTKKSTINQLLGAGGTATLASATITGDLTVDTSTLKVDSANDAVGVGTATPASYASSKLSVYTASNTLLTIAQATSYSNLQSNGYDLYINTNVGGANSNAGNFIIRHGSGSTEQFRIASDGVATWSNVGGVAGTAMTLNSTGLGVGVTPSAGRGAIQLSAGVGFPATQVASSDANTLDDYEEGTFTPTVVGATSAGTATYSAQTGYYTKIGRLVTVNIYLDWNSATGTGQMRFGGLPFTSSSSSLSFSAAYFGLVNGIALTANHVLTGYTETNNTVISATSYPAGGGTYASVPVDSAGELVITCTYMAA